MSAKADAVAAEPVDVERFALIRERDLRDLVALARVGVDHVQGDTDRLRTLLAGFLP